MLVTCGSWEMNLVSHSDDGKGPGNVEIYGNELNIIACFCSVVVQITNIKNM